MRHESIDTTMRYYMGRNAQTTADVLWQVRQNHDVVTRASPAPAWPISPDGRTGCPAGHYTRIQEIGPRMFDAAFPDRCDRHGFVSRHGGRLARSRVPHWRN